MRKSQTERAIESLEAEKHVLEAAIAKLKQQLLKHPRGTALLRQLDALDDR